MAEIVAFDDSPLGQYLLEIGAHEDLVIDEKANSLLTELDTHAPRKQQWTSKAFQQFRLLVSSLFGTTNNNVDKIAHVVWNKVVTVLTDSGHMADKYTPRKTRWSATDSSTLLIGTRRLDAVRLGMKQAAFPAGIGCLLVGWRGLTSSRRLPITMSTHMTAAAFVSALIAGIAANGVWKQIRAEKLACAANNYIQAFTSMVQNCRALDNSLYAALRFVQEIDFVSRGFRLPHQSTLFAQTPKRGSLLIAQNMRQAIDSALTHMLQTLFGIAPDLEAIAYGSMSCVDDESDTDGGNTPDTLSLDMLRGKFNTQFEARRAWIDSLLEILEPLSSMSISQARIHTIFDSTVANIQQLDAAAVRGLETVRQVRESQYTSRQWASLAQNTDSEHSNQPLRRALGSMSTVLATIQAKMSVCQECINVVDSIDAASEPNGKDTSKEAAALFASLKLDIDVLSAHYQDCVAMLHGDNTGCSGSVSGAVAEISAYEDEPDTPLDGVNIYGYTPLGSSDLDAPYMLYEADAETSQTSKRPHATLDRIDRIRMQKQNRIDEETAKQKKNDVFSMINELKVAIDSRSKDHLDPNSDKS